MDAVDLTASSPENQSDWCVIENGKSEWKTLATIFSLECVLASASFVANFVFLVIIRKVKVMPINIRCLLAHLSMTLLLFNAAILSKAISFLSVDDPCSMRMSAFECRLRELPLSLPWAAMFYSLFGICIERLFTTFYGRNSDHAPIMARPILAAACIVITWTVTLVNQCSALFSVSRTRMLAVCEVGLSLESSSIPIPVAINMTLEISSICAMVAVTVYENYVARNMAINRVLYSLSTRFLITQNVQVNAMMLPSMLLHVICYLPNMIFYLLVVHNTPMSGTTKWMIIHLSYLWILFYSLCYPLLAFARNFHVKKQLKKTKLWMALHQLWKRSTGKVAAAYNHDLLVENNIRAHFEYLEQIWTLTYQKQRRDQRSV